MINLLFYVLSLELGKLVIDINVVVSLLVLDRTLDTTGNRGLWSKQLPAPGQQPQQQQSTTTQPTSTTSTQPPSAHLPLDLGSPVTHDPAAGTTIITQAPAPRDPAAPSPADAAEGKGISAALPPQRKRKEHAEGGESEHDPKVIR